MLDPERPSDGSTPLLEDLQFSVRFEDGSWLLDSRHCFETLVFASGGAAETAARTMAARFAECGRGVRVLIEDNLHAVVGTRLYFASDAASLGNEVREGRLS